MADEKKKKEPAYEWAEKNERYMEGNYDNSGNKAKGYKQIADDVYQSIQTEELIKASQEAVYEKETERLSYEYKAKYDEFEKLIKDYIEQDIYKQYLVDGAVLRCNKATTDDFDFDGGTVELENKADEVCNIILDVHENPMDINGLTYATIKDTIKNVNIIAPKCNCSLTADRDAEIDSIKNDTDRNKNGVCMHLMRLNEEWDNFEVDGTTYLTKKIVYHQQEPERYWMLLLRRRRGLQ